MVNTVVMILPNRHDLIPSSHVSTEVLNFNRQVKKKEIL